MDRKVPCTYCSEYHEHCYQCRAATRREKWKKERSHGREEEVMVEDWRSVQEVKEALGLRGEPFHAEVQGNGVKFVYPQLKKDVKDNDK